MAAVTSEVTVDTGEWTYVDRYGVEHAVTNGETFNLEIADTSETVVKYHIAPAQTVATDDGYVVTFRPHTNVGNVHSKVETMADAVTSYEGYPMVLGGEFPMSISVDDTIQIWKIATLAPSNVDFDGAGTIAATFEDQFGNTMSWVAGMTVAQAA